MSDPREPRPTKLEVDELGDVERIIYVREGIRYEHEFESAVTLSATTDGQHLILHGGELSVDDDGWIHG